MFTGLIEGTGKISALEPRSGQTRLRIAPTFAMQGFVHGESIAVNGACLTVETFSDTWFTAYASAETLSKTNLGALRQGDLVNLERALALGDRLGGHLVSGHVDCLATVASIEPAGESRIYRLNFPAPFGPQVVEKGSVTLDGISLTVNLCGPDFLTVNIIPATLEATTMGSWSPGTRVNLETDLIGKYVQRMLAARFSGDSAAESDHDQAGLTREFLGKHGF
ncbi:MAG: riboflavin synthase [Desulfovibrio sp.]|nr:MAG: riboflavin synthase [Desulfovibrio sp.]